jgi:hypothetical protein
MKERNMPGPDSLARRYPGVGQQVATAKIALRAVEHSMESETIAPADVVELLRHVVGNAQAAIATLEDTR